MDCVKDDMSKKDVNVDMAANIGENMCRPHIMWDWGIKNCQYEEEEYHSGSPVITLEVLSDSSNMEQSNVIAETHTSNSSDSTTKDMTGVHFLIEKTEPPESNDKEDSKESKVRTEYMVRDNGSVICNLCGEVLQSRSHWYRHKYKLHVMHPLNPSPLFQCELCLVYFKSRKGYIGHLASRHSEVLSDCSPVLTNSQAESIGREKAAAPLSTISIKEENDPELSIPKSSVPNYQTSVVKQTPKVAESRRVVNVKDTSNKEDCEERRTREEKLVADIIDRVRRECEAQGSGSATRRGYTRRTTVMHT